MWQTVGGRLGAPTGMAKDALGGMSKTKKRALGLLALSLAVHLAVSTVAWISGALHPKKAQVTQAPMKVYPAELFLPGGMHANPSKKPPGLKKPIPAPDKPSTELVRNEKAAPPEGRPVAADHAPVPGIGTDTASADPAFPIFSPQPAVTDRSLLPATDRQVIVDVKVSAGGDVLEATLVSGIGNALDALVLTTVKTWRFHPAMMNGNPVPTEAELIFPFSERTMTTPS